MTANALRGPIGRAAFVRATSLAIERSLGRFHVGYRPRLARLAQRHARVAELALTFPGLLFAIGVPGHGLDPRAALDFVISGAELKIAAAAAGVPWWLRRLPPEAFDRPLAGLPDGEGFRRRIANHLPAARKHASAWLNAMVEAARWGDDAAAIWVARELVRGRMTVRGLRLLVLYAWYSGRPQTSAHRLIGTAWHAGMHAATACQHADDWIRSVSLRANLGDRTLDPWLAPGQLSEFEFVPLLSAQGIAEEAAAMDNCVRDYGDTLVHDRERLWSVRCKGERVATLSVGFRGELIEILDLKGRANAKVPRGVWLTARRWIAEHDLMAIRPKHLTWGAVALDHHVWREFWRPYWVAKRHIPAWLPLTPTRRALEDLTR
jgi:hypothetical protein